MDRPSYLISFIIILLSVGINTAQHLLLQLNISHNYLLLTLIAIATAGLIAHRQLLFLLLVFGLSVTINLPTDALMHYGIDRDILFVTLLSVIIVPAGAKFWA